MEKKVYKSGKGYVFKPSKDEEEQVIQWLNDQSVFADSIRYLIQKEIAENGLRNLQLYIPRERSIETIKDQLSRFNDIPKVAEYPTLSDSSLQYPKDNNNVVLDNNKQIEIGVDQSRTAESSDNMLNKELKKEESVISQLSNNPMSKPSRPAKKSFDTNIIKTYE